MKGKFTIGETTVSTESCLRFLPLATAKINQEENDGQNIS